jgi:hypothetical protein
VGNSPLVDDVSFANALSLVCSIEGCQKEVVARLTSLGLGDMFEKGACSCRCAERSGCQIGGDLFERAVCILADVDSCQGAFELEEVGGGEGGESALSAVSCALSANTCQQYGSKRNGVCAPFMSPDTSIFVPAGETIESFEGDIKALLFEAALVSSACFKAHGDLMCSMRLKRCQAQPDDQVAPERLCRRDCVENAKGRDELCRLPVFNAKWNSEDQVAEGFSTASMCDGVVGTSTEPLVCSNGDCPLNHPQYEWIRAADFLALDTLGKPMFPDAGGCVSLYESVAVGEAQQQVTHAFSIPRALDVIQCPYPFKKNFKANAEGLQTNEGVYSRFCVTSCSTTIYSNSENRIMWAAYAIPGSIAAVMNFLGLLSFDSKTSDPLIIFMIGMGMLYGAFGTLPSLVLFDEVPCICGTEDCFHRGFVCKLSTATTFVIQSILFALCTKMYLLAHKMQYMTGNSNTKAAPLQIAAILLVACGLCIAGFILDDDAYDSKQYNLHIARSTFSCKMRLESFALEFVIMHLPLLIAGVGIVVFIFRILMILRESTAKNKEAIGAGKEKAFCINNVFAALLAKKNRMVLITVLLGTMVASILLFTTTNTIASAPLFIVYNEDYFKWFVLLNSEFFSDQD